MKRNREGDSMRASASKHHYRYYVTRPDGRTGPVYETLAECKAFIAEYGGTHKRVRHYDEPAETRAQHQAEEYAENAWLRHAEMGDEESRRDLDEFDRAIEARR